MDECERCLYGSMDEDGETVCSMPMDEDEATRSFHQKRCPYFRVGDEYTIVKRQN